MTTEEFDEFLSIHRAAKKARQSRDRWAERKAEAIRMFNEAEQRMADLESKLEERRIALGLPDLPPT